MTSSKQIQSNKQNSLKSTGPKTPEGKAVVSQNAVKHGLLAREVVIADESPQEWELFKQRVFMALEPAGEVETLLAERISACAWRLRRILSIESGLLDESRDKVHTAFSIQEYNLKTLMRYEACTERGMYKALHELQRLQTARQGKPVSCPQTVDVSVSAE